MRAFVCHGHGRKAWEVRVDAVTICGTDLHILKGDVLAVTDGRILATKQSAS